MGSAQDVEGNADGARKPCIALIDDDSLIRMVTSASLEGVGFDVREAEDGQSGYALIAQHAEAIDIVLLDREMPVMNGVELLCKLKSDPACSKIPVIMQSGSGKVDHVNECMDAGAFHYLVKPVDPDLLCLTLAAALEATGKQKTGIVCDNKAGAVKT